MVNFKSGALTETTLYILCALKEPLHGYGIMQAVEEMTAGRLSLGPGTLYGALQTLQKNGMIKTIGQPEGGRNKKTYQITGDGLIILKSELERINELARNLAKALDEV